MSDHESDENAGLKDAAYSPASEREQQERDAPGGESSAATADQEVDGEDVRLLPGTGGPDDQGDTQVSGDEVSLNGRPFPGHAGGSAG